MKTKSLFIIVSTLIIAAGCTSAPTSKPHGLDALAAKFSAKAGADRVTEGRRLAASMPDAPERHWNKYWWAYLGFSEDIYFDYDHPTYQLPENEILPLLGKPDRDRTIDNDGHWRYTMYEIGRDRHGDELGLYIHSRNGLIVTGFVLATNTPEMISNRGNRDGSITSTTNYVQ